MFALGQLDTTLLLRGLAVHHIFVNVIQGKLCLLSWIYYQAYQHVRCNLLQYYTEFRLIGLEVVGHFCLGMRARVKCKQFTLLLASPDKSATQPLGQRDAIRCRSEDCALGERAF